MGSKHHPDEDDRAGDGNFLPRRPMQPCMAPRAIRPGIYHATFSVVRRLYLLWPGKRLNQVIRYLAALTSERYGVLIHDLTAMSNHVHLEVGDQYGNHPEAFAFFESMLARQVNAMLGETGSVFEPYEVVELLDDGAILDTAGYVLANPVKDHLVEKAAQWPGVTTCTMKYGERAVIKRPAVGLWADLKDKRRRVVKKRKPDSTGRLKYRGKPSELPDEVVFELVRPPVLPARGDEEVRQEVLARVAKAEDTARAERRATGRKVGNVKGLARRHATEMSTEKPKSWRQMFGRRPRHAGADELVRAAKLRDQEWDREYRERRQRLLNGDRESLWPEHTWKMRMYCGMPCEGPPPKWPLMIGPLPPS